MNDSHRPRERLKPFNGDLQDVQSQIFLYESANHSEARLDWYLIPKDSYELYAGGDPVGPRFSLYLVDQVKSIEECSQKLPTPSKHLLRINYLNTTMAPLNIWFQQKEDLKSWVDALKKALDLGRKFVYKNCWAFEQCIHVLLF